MCFARMRVDTLHVTLVLIAILAPTFRISEGIVNITTPIWVYLFIIIIKPINAYTWHFYIWTKYVCLLFKKN